MTCAVHKTHTHTHTHTHTIQYNLLYVLILSIMVLISGMCEFMYDALKLNIEEFAKQNAFSINDLTQLHIISDNLPTSIDSNRLVVKSFLNH